VTDGADAALAREAAVFGRYLAGAPATATQARHYAAAQVALPGSPSRFERVQLAFARMHPVLTRAADAYGRIAAPRSLLRHKLVLLLAILESSAPTHRAYAAAGSGAAGAFVRMSWAGLLFAAHLGLGALVLVPVQVVSVFGGRR